MKEKILILKSEISADQKRLERLFEKFESSYEAYHRTSEYSKLVESAFYLNQIYSGFERIFKNVASVFENNISDDLWHKSLLDRASIEIEDIRPAIISNDTHRCLDELRTFRHFFRHAYDTDIDASKFKIVAQSAKTLRNLFKKDFKKFTVFLHKLTE